MLFTVQQIKQAHSDVKSGADFPRYIQSIRQLGVIAFTTWVADGHTDYFGSDSYQTTSEPMYALLAIAQQSDKQKFEHALAIHQQGKTDYLTFCQHCAETGIEKWFVSLHAMTCTYYDKTGKEVLEEKIPQ